MLARLNRRPRGFYGLERFGAIEAALATGLQMETIRSSLPSDGTIPCMLTVLMISFAPLPLSNDSYLSRCIPDIRPISSCS